MLRCSIFPAARLYGAVLLAICWILASCSTTPVAGRIENPDWEISGKIGVKEDSVGASTTLFQWQQQEDRYTIFLLNPLGQTELILSGNNQHAQAEKPDGSSITAGSPEELLQQLTGWHFPLSSARFWLQGKTGGSELETGKTPEGLLGSFTTGPWHVTLDQYKPVEGHPLPHRVRLQQPDLDITLIIKKHAYFNH